MVDSPNRIASTTVAPSPTGTPIIKPGIVPILSVGVGIAGLLLTVVPPHTLFYKLLAGAVAIGTGLGIASPGWRK